MVASSRPSRRSWLSALKPKHRGLGDSCPGASKACRPLALANGDKDLNFETALGPMAVKAKFNLKEMSQAAVQGL